MSASEAEIKRTPSKKDTKSKAGFEVEYRLDGHYYICAVPENCNDINVGDRVLEINGVKSFNFQSAARANDLFDTLCLLYYDKDKPPVEDDDSESSEETAKKVARQRKGRRTNFEEEARRIGAERQYERSLSQKKLKEIEEEEQLKRTEAQLRRLEHERRKAEEEAAKPPEPEPKPPSRVSVSVVKNIGAFSPTPKRGFVKGGWSKVNSNHKLNG